MSLNRDVERGGDLVAQQELWFDGQRARNADALTLATGEFVRIAQAQLGIEPHLAQELTHLGVDVGARRLVLAQLRQNPAVYPPDSTFDRLEWITDVGEAIKLYDRAWTELKLR